MDTSNQQRERPSAASEMRDPRRVMKALRASFAALLLLALAAGPAAASAVAGQARDAAAAPDYLSSEPENGAMLDEAPEQVSVTFDEPIDPDSSLSISDECGRKIDDGNVQVDPNSMTVGISLTPSGTYTATYFVKGLGGVTGQQTGTFSFMVHSGESCDGGDGHGGHGNGGGGKGHGNGGHGGGKGDGHRGGDQHGGDHMAGGGDSHDDGTHGSTGHTSSRDHGASHSDMDHPKKGGHGSGHGGRQGGKHGTAHPPLVPRAPEEDDGTTLASEDGAIPVAPDGAAVLTALGLSLAMGAVGGWFLRMSGAR
jgi:methionine-rich copper-binding protein CopC